VNLQKLQKLFVFSCKSCYWKLTKIPKPYWTTESKNDN